LNEEDASPVQEQKKVLQLKKLWSFLNKLFFLEKKVAKRFRPLAEIQDQITVTRLAAHEGFAVQPTLFCSIN
jgi:hypothetical protein